MKGYYIPNGPANLQQLFPDIPFERVSEYYIEVIDEDDDIVATTPVNKMGCCCTPETVRILFLNHFGTFDGIDFQKPAISQKTEAENYIKGLPTEFNSNASGKEKIIKSVEVKKTAKNNCYSESEMPWIKQLFSSPKAYEEYKNLNGASKYIPVVIEDSVLTTQKNDKEYNGEFNIEYVMSNQEIPIRN